MKYTDRPNRRFARQGKTTSSVSLDRHHRESREPASFTATEAKNEFGRILEKAIQGETVVITKHDSPKAVLISVDQFNALQHAPEFKLDTLSGEFDALLARMQGSKARTAMKAAFSSSPQQLGKAAVLAARKHG
ncbi:MAG: type II toxin-antitoxin system Phd/YefM family antitoxin [Candidatus Korobacteraceae bacterium]|jgi:prevent-host-death family protein